MIIGITGMLGHKLFEIAKREGHDVYGTVRGESHEKNVYGVLDITDKKRFENVVEKVKPELVINCAGVIKPLSTKDMTTTIKINSLAPHQIAKTCKKHDVRLIHVSTDCVFSGRKGNYSEEDMTDPQDLYGQSKLLGEITDKPNVLTVRTSFIGRELTTSHGLLEWFLKQEGTINGYSNAYFTGLTSNELSRVLLKLGEKRVSGLVHIGGEKIDKYSLLKLANELFKKNLKINKYEDFHCDRALNSTKLKSLGIKVPSMKQMLKEIT
jgi:dTDP-4-dehydrorhamnose reductase